MPLKRRNEFQVFENTDTVEITPLENEALVIKRVMVDGPGANNFAQVLVGKTTVGYHPVSIENIELFKSPTRDVATRNILDYFNGKGINLTYPVASGENFLLKFGSTVERVKVVYDVFDAGDIDPTSPNGSKSDILTFINTITHSGDITASEFVRLDKSLAPAELPDFPVATVPAGMQVQLHSIMAVPLATSVGDGTASLGTSYTKYLRLFYRRQVLFDPSRNGFVVLGNSAYSETSTTQTYDYTEIHNDLPIPLTPAVEARVFDPPLTFNAGEEVNFEAYAVVNSNAPIGAGKFRVLVLYTIRPLR